MKRPKSSMWPQRTSLLPIEMVGLGTGALRRWHSPPCKKSHTLALCHQRSRDTHVRAQLSSRIPGLEEEKAQPRAATSKTRTENAPAKDVTPLCLTHLGWLLGGKQHLSLKHAVKISHSVTFIKHCGPWNIYQSRLLLPPKGQLITSSNKADFVLKIYCVFPVKILIDNHQENNNAA